jgi:hypothetical protein
LIEPEALLFSPLSDTICSDQTTSAQWQATGGTGNYSFSIVGGADADNLVPGEYTALVVDANGCEAQANFTIGTYPQVNFIASADSVCAGETASLQYFGFGGVLPYEYDWQGQNPTALPAGDYTFTLTDSNGCEDVVQLEVAAFPVLEVSISELLNSNGGNNGSIELLITGGEQPYSILWNTGSTEALLDSIGSGIYTVIVTDANGCEASAIQNIIDLGIETILDGLQFYPNPVESSLQIHIGSAGSYEVWNSLGDRISLGLLKAGINTIDFHALSGGLYVVKVRNEREAGSFKVVRR